MNIYVVSTQEKLKIELEHESQIEEVIIEREIKSDVQADVLVIDGEVVDHRELKQVRERFREIPVFYILHNIQNHLQARNIETICQVHHIMQIPEDLTVQQIAREVSQYLFNTEAQRPSKVVSFFGTHSGAGVSTTCQSTAFSLSQKVDGKVLLLNLNPHDPGDYFFHFQGKYLNDLKSELRANSLQENSFLEGMYCYDNQHFAYISGNRDVKMQRFYQPEEINLLIRTAANCFDVVLIDGGAHFDNACYAQSYMNAEYKLLVTTQERKGYAGVFPYVYEQLIEPLGRSMDDYLLVVNKYDQELTPCKDIESQLRISMLTTIPDQGKMSYFATNEGKVLYEMSDRRYQHSIDLIADSIMTRVRLTPKASSAEQTSMLRRFVEWQKR